MITPQELTQIIKNYYLAYVWVGSAQENVHGLLYRNALNILLRQIVAENVVNEMETIDVRKERLLAVFMQQISGPITDGLREAMHQEVVNALRHIDEKRGNNLPLTPSEIRMMNTQQQYIEIKFNHALPLLINQARSFAVAFFEGYQWGPAITDFLATKTPSLTL